ncbi:MAG: IclR family transcriptional regulator [Actinomycetota bacterium]|jgi:IclR family transcriptional regulator, acetate operon repressor
MARTPVESPDGKDTSTAASKVLAILDVFRSEQMEFSLTEVARGAGVSKPTTYRLLAALERWGGVRRTPSGRYSLGMKFFELGGLVPERQRLRDLALPYMEDLLIATNGHVHLVTLEGNDVVVLDRLLSHQGATAPSRVRVGGREPASCSAVGKAILAFSPPEVVEAVLERGLAAETPYSITDRNLFLKTLGKIRRDGVAYGQEELFVGRACVGAPVFDHTGRVVAAISVSGPVTRMPLESFAPAVRAATNGVSRALGYRHPALHPHPGG